MSSTSSSRRRWIAYVGLALAFGWATWFFAFRSTPVRRGSSFGSFMRGSSAVPVRAVPAERKDLPVYLRAIGTVVPLNTVTVRSRVEGQLLRVAFEEGQTVTQGQLLAEIDPLTYQIRLAQVEGQQRQNVAQLQTAKADLERFKQLHAQALVSSQQLEQQQALVAEREGAVAADQAQVETARLQLAYTRVEAPIAGRLGLRQVDVGNLIRPNDAGGLVVITQTQPIAVSFTVPEMDLRAVIDPIRAGEQLEVEAWDRGEARVLAIGVLRTVDNQIDLATGTLRLKAEFPNTDERLFPNQFVNVRLRVRTLKDAVVIPAAAVQYGSRGTYVFAVNADSQATVRDIVLGPGDGLWQAVAKGVQAGERVVTEGIDRLREGRAVILVEGGSAPPLPPPAPGSDGPGAGGGPAKAKGGGEKAKKEKAKT